MKTSPLYVLPIVLLLYPCPSVANPVPTPMFGIPLRVTAALDTAVLYFGILPVADRCMNPTDCFHGHCESGLLPIPPPPAFDARFLPAPSCTGNGSLCDFRPFIIRAQRDTFRVSTQFNGAEMITLQWPAGLDSFFTELHMEYPGSPGIDMLTDTSLTITNTSGQLNAIILSNGLVVAGVEENPIIANRFELLQNYPNPFNPSTKIVYRVGSPATAGRRESIGLKVFDVLGREVATLVNEVKEPGTYEVLWDASGHAGGVYLYRLQVGSFIVSNRMILIK